MKYENFTQMPVWKRVFNLMSLSRHPQEIPRGLHCYLRILYQSQTHQSRFHLGPGRKKKLRLSRLFFLSLRLSLCLCTNS